MKKYAADTTHVRIHYIFRTLYPFFIGNKIPTVNIKYTRFFLRFFAFILNALRVGKITRGKEGSKTFFLLNRYRNKL